MEERAHDSLMTEARLLLAAGCIQWLSLGTEVWGRRCVPFFTAFLVLGIFLLRALRLARNLANGDILNFIELSEEYSIMECRCPRQWQGKSIRELDVRARHRLNIIAIRRGGGMTISPGGEYALQEEDELVVLGRNEDIREVERL